jgi:RNA polymerase sigma-70 factor, ECF subfamily
MALTRCGNPATLEDTHVRDVGQISAQTLRLAGEALNDTSRHEQPDFSLVFNENLPVVLRYVLARVNDLVLAEDLTGDVFEQAVRGWDRFEGRSSPRTWLLGIARHVVSRHRRRAIPQTLPLEVAPPSSLQDEGESPEAFVERRGQERLLHQALAELSTGDQELLALRYAAELSHREIAEVLGAREIAVRVRLHRAIGRLGHVLTGMEEIR